MSPSYKEKKQKSGNVLFYLDHFNRRIRVDCYSGEMKDVIAIIQSEEQTWVEKIIVKSRVEHLAFFIGYGYVVEGVIQKYFLGEDMYFLAKYPSSNRQMNNLFEQENQIIKIITKNSKVKPLNLSKEILVATKEDAVALAKLYQEVFPIYPTPIQEESYILKTMKTGTLYVCVYEGNQIVSAASAEINEEFLNAELTDCATLQHTEGKGYMKQLLFYLELELKKRGVCCLYTIARSASFSMNKVFHSLGYTYGGRLHQNCQITSGLENMNVWYKNVSK